MRIKIRRTSILALVVTSLVAAITVVLGAPAAAAADEFDMLREKWKVGLDGGPNLDTSDPDVVSILSQRSGNAESLWASMDTTPSTYVWSDLTDVSGGAQTILATYTRLRDLAVAWSTMGTTVYQNATLRADIIAALDWLNAHWYNDSIAMHGNWWEWVIGVPFRLRDIMTIMYADLSPAQKTNYVDAIDHFTPQITSPAFASWAGANRSDILLQQLICGVIMKDGTRISQVRDLMSPMFDLVTSGSGTYADGSHIDHVNVAYTLGYGTAMLASMSSVMSMLQGSTWTIVDPDAQNFYSNIYRVYEPLIYRGAAMDMVRGRNIARQEDHAVGHATIATIALISRYAPPADAANFRSMVKTWLTEDASLDWHTYLQYGPVTYLLIRDIMNDSSIPLRPELVGHFAYNSMDRTVHRADGWAFAISKSSKRVWNYELTNFENVKGWYTGDGATYLYNGDLDQFSNNYWPTVNAMRLPGTTTEIRSRYSGNPPGHKEYGDGEGLPSNSWSGGTALDTYGVSGMNLIPVGGNEGGSLNALKSWFMFDDEVVALGAGIRTTNPLGRRVETVIENRRLNDSGSNEFTVNGAAKSSIAGWAEDMTGVRYAHLNGTAPGSDIGYYFPGGAGVQGIRQTRSGRWADISTAAGSTTTYTNTYLTLTAQHGVDPTNASYSYVLLPNKTEAETSSYANAADIAVLENSTYVQAVREKTLQVTGYNFWTDTTRSSGDLTSNKKASIMTQETSGSRYDIAVSDPTQENTGTITVEIDRRGYSVISKDPRITVVQMSPTIKLNVNVNTARGAAFQASFDLAPSIAYQPMSMTTEFSDNFDAQPVGAVPTGWTVTSPSSTSVAIDATPSATDHSVRMTDTNAAGSASVRRSFPVQNGLVVAEWKFMEPYSIMRLPYFQLYSGSTTAISLYTTMNCLRYVAGNGVSVDSAPIMSNTWHAVKLVIDTWNKRYDLYVDAELRIQGASFTTAVTSIDAISFRTGYSTSPSTVYIDNVKVSRVSPGTNLALAATGTATSSYEGSGWGLAKINDGQRRSLSGLLGWSSGAGTAAARTESLTLDLGSATQVGRVDLYPRNDSPTQGMFFPVNFTIATSTDGLAWTTQVTELAHIAPGDGYQTFTFPSTNARYVRIEGTLLQLVGTESRMQFAEVEVY